MKAQLAPLAESWRPVFQSAGVRTLVRSIVFLVLLSIAYRIGMALIARVAQHGHPAAFPLLLAVFAGAAAYAFAFRGYRYAEIWTPIRVLLQGTGLVFGVQVLFDAFYPSAFVSNLFIGEFTDARVLVGLALAAGVLALRRPAFLLPFYLAYFMFRFRAPVPYAFPDTFLDFATPLDVGAFGILALLAARTYDAAHRSPAARLLQSVRLPGDPQHSLGYKKVLWGLVVGIHLGNYFHSALAKIELGEGNPFFWVLQNPTERAIAIGLHRTINPFAQWPWLLDALHGTLQTWYVPFNVFVLAVQFLCPLSALNRRALILFTLAFDLMHLGIYGTLGAFFLLWIALNVIILISLSRMTDQEFTRDIKITAMVTAILGYLSFSTAELGWLDGVKVVRTVFYARTEDGRQVPVPPAMFGLASYKLAHATLDLPPGHFKVRYGGNVNTRREWEDANTCGPAVVERRQTFTPVDRVERLVRDAHRNLSDHPWIKQMGLFYAYPHHLPTNPTQYPAFNRLDMEDVRGYSYVVESACLYVTNGRLTEKVVKRSEVPLDVPL